MLGIQNSLVGAIAVAMGSDGLFYFACLTPVMGSNFGVVTVRDFNSRVSDFQYAGVSGPTGVAIDGQNRVYVANHRNGTISRVYVGDGSSPGAHSAQTLAGDLSFGSDNLPNHLFLDAAENLYICETAANRIQLLSGSDLGIFASQGLNQPVGIAQRANGNFLVSNHGNGTIVELNAGGEVVQVGGYGIGRGGALRHHRARQRRDLRRGRQPGGWFGVSGEYAVELKKDSPRTAGLRSL